MYLSALEQAHRVNAIGGNLTDLVGAECRREVMEHLIASLNNQQMESVFVRQLAHHVVDGIDHD